MNVAVRYQSRGGNTRAVAEVIASTLGVEAKPLSEPLEGHVDMLFLGGGVYRWDADPALVEYLKELDAKQVSQVVAFSTTGGMKAAVNRIMEYAIKAGVRVNEKQLCIKLYLQGHTLFRREGGHLTDEQAETVRAFAKQVTQGM